MRKKQPKTKSFDSLTKAQQRVAIAKDARDQILLGNFIPTTGDFCVFQNTIQVNRRNLSRSCPNCRVCELGSLFVSSVRLGNQIDAAMKMAGPHTTYKQLEHWFSAEQLALIENAYELGMGAFQGGGDGVLDEHCKLKAAQKMKAIAFGKQYGDLRHLNQAFRMLAILSNIIDNQGEFIP